MTDLLTEPAPPAPADAPAFATVVAQDGRLLRLQPEGDGALTLMVEGTRLPLRLDTFQALAFTAAVRSLGGTA
ncbi:MAG: hypothetical protein K2X46_15050 [Roseomonas sp.]|nr:hypothetical protein [Roseomonas sp.]